MAPDLEQQGMALLAELAAGPPGSVEDALTTCAALYAARHVDLGVKLFRALRPHVELSLAREGWAQERLELLRELDRMVERLAGEPALFAALAAASLGGSDEELDAVARERIRRRLAVPWRLFDDTPRLHALMEGTFETENAKRNLHNGVVLGVAVTLGLIVWKLLPLLIRALGR